ncbi:unnamed protein product [Didymodactylos carnosus]|uniref:Transglutaminase-like domain-containing protein n=1 Tax=Didymodactylos carnosus TaxID=1234261 RepID=A0A815F2C5_9BILA|nr:unnamed protein product [Didymodactylos carnosus]CAF1563148.1 unnamed protein product [Didymodactylos carnosus]CAF4161367.1 unnamed protein product [Didymodactylos carnosus]CAF4355478.1 unnamed protein product [Didymodactylos carnosus]
MNNICQQRQNVLDNNSSREIIDSWQPSSLDELICNMKQFLSDKYSLDKAWCVFYWITQNIHYDNTRSDQTVESVFKSRSATSSGYTNLFKRLCDEIDLNCEIIKGTVRTIYKRISHEWNAVELEKNHWYLIDSAWGSYNQLNEKSLDLYYFLTPSTKLIQSHIPNDKQWQLLIHPGITKEQQLNVQPKFSSAFHDYRMDIVSPLVWINNGSSYFKIQIRAPDYIQLISSIEYTKDGRKGSSLTHYDGDKCVWECLLAPQTTGIHKIIICAKSINTNERYSQCVRFDVNVTDLNYLITFPYVSDLFQSLKCQLFEPISDNLKIGVKVTLRYRIPKAKNIQIQVGTSLQIPDHYENNIFKSHITVPNDNILIMGQLNNQSYYSTLVKYSTV